MVELNRLVARASARLFAVRAVWSLVFGLMAAVAGMVLVRVAERLFAFPIDWMTTWLIALGAGIAGALGWTYWTKADRLAVARELDEQAGLRESISTALCVAGKDDPWSRASVEHARSLVPKVVVARAFPVRLPRSWPAPLIGVAVFFLLGLVPRADVLNILSKSKAEEEKQAEVHEAKAQVREMDKKLDELLSKVGEESLKEEAAEESATPNAAPASPEEIRREAVKKLTSMQDRLNDLKQGDKAGSLEAIQNKLEQLKQPVGAMPEMNSLVQNMQAGKFQQAQEDLDKLAQKLAQQQLSPEEKEKLAKQLEDLAKQLEKLAEQRKELEQALQQAGLDPGMAMDPEALKKALEKMENLSPEQKQQLQQMCNNASAANKMCQQMGEACKNAASAMAAGKPGSAEMGELGDQLSQMEMMQAEMEALDAAMSECKSQLSALGECMGGQGESESQNPFASMPRKGPAKGQGDGGGQAPAPKETDVAFKKEKATSPQQGGPIVGSMMVKGEQVRGESVQQFGEAVKAGQEEMAEAIETMQVPREYHEALKHYFGALEEKAKEAAKKPAPVKN